MQYEEYSAALIPKGLQQHFHCVALNTRYGGLNFNSELGVRAKLAYCPV